MKRILRNRIKDSISLEEKKTKIEDQIKFLSKLRKIIGMPGISRENNVIYRTRAEEETVRSLRWSEKIEKKKNEIF